MKQLLVTYDDLYLDWLLGKGDGSHPTNPVRAQLATALLKKRLGERVRVIHPQPADKVETDKRAMLLVHDGNYVSRTLAGTNGEWYENKPSVAAAGCAMFGGTMRAVEALLTGEALVDFNPQGAKHHARRASGSGFCVFNDMAAAALLLQAQGLKVLYIDWDIHAGDGVMHLLEGSGIPCISIHLASGYPADSTMQTGVAGELHNPEKHQYNFNVEHGANDEVFMACIDAAADIIDKYQPDVILLAAGADGHTGSGNLGQLANYTGKGYRYAAQMIAEKANAYAQGRVIIGGAGGYQPLKETPETWALVVEEIYNTVCTTDRRN